MQRLIRTSFRHFGRKIAPKEQQEVLNKVKESFESNMTDGLKDTRDKIFKDFDQMSKGEDMGDFMKAFAKFEEMMEKEQKKNPKFEEEIQKTFEKFKNQVTPEDIEKAMKQIK